MIKKIKKFFKKNIIYLILLILLTYFNINCAISNQYQHKSIPNNKNYLITHNNTNYKSIFIQSDTITINYPKKIQFSGNVNITHNDHCIKSDKLTILYNKKHQLLYTLYADGHVNYNNNYIEFTGHHAWIDLIDKNINIYKSKYHLITPHIHGSADILMQRKNNRYTIAKKGNFTFCSIDSNSWNIQGSQIVYDHIQNNIDIWDAVLKIKKIPIFYSPYIFLPVNQNNVLSSYIPNIQYSYKNGLIFKIPCPTYSSKYCSGNIFSYYIPNIGIKFTTKINYTIQPQNTGFIIFNIVNQKNKINKNKPLTDHNNTQLYNLCWKHNNITHKKWNFNVYYLSKNYFNIFTNTNSTYKKNIINDSINQKFICNYNHKHWHAKIAYLNFIKNPNKNTHYHNYAATPQLELYSNYNFHIGRNPLIFKIFNQITKFTSKNPFFSETIRIHAEPSIYYTIYNNWSDFNIETKLYLTHYQQKNFEYYNTKKYSKNHLQNNVSRVVPKFKINKKIILKNNTYTLKKYQHFLESKWQYVYVPYRFQENIGIYDTSVIHIDYNNFFNDSIYSGLDRISPANHITSNITLRYLNKTHEFFYVSIGQILNLSKYYISNNTYITKNTHKHHNFLLFSGVSHFNFNNYWRTHAEIQYDTQHHNIPFGTIILEYIGNKNKKIIQTQYRYINAQYIQKILLYPKESIYCQKIAQFGILMHFPIHYNWKISFSHYHNTKTKKIIDQILGLQYYTPCWNINTVFERKIIDINNITKNNIYDKKIKLDINISHLKNNLKSDSYKTLNMGIIPYQHVF